MEREELACQKLAMELSIQANQELMATYKESVESNTQAMYCESTGSSETCLTSEQPNNGSKMASWIDKSSEFINLLSNAEVIVNIGMNILNYF